MTPIYVAINAVAMATVWLAVIGLALSLVRNDKLAVQWRILLLRIGLAGLPVVLILGSVEHVLPWVRPLLRVDRADLPVASRRRDAGTPGRRERK